MNNYCVVWLVQWCSSDFGFSSNQIGSKPG